MAVLENKMTLDSLTAAQGQTHALIIKKKKVWIHPRSFWEHYLSSSGYACTDSFFA